MTVQNLVRPPSLISRPDATAVNAPLPAGPGGFDTEKDGRVFLVIEIRQLDMRVNDWQGNTTGWLLHGGVVAGDFNPLTGEVPPGPVADHRHIIINGLTGAIPFVPAFGLPNQWFLPNATGGTVTFSLYGWEVALDVDCQAGGSTSGDIASDRLTFHEVLDLEGLSRPRGFAHELPPNHIYQTELQVTGVTVPPGSPPGPPVFSNINDVIAPDHLSFVSRAGSVDFAGGTWTKANPAPVEDGTLRVMAS